MLEFMSYAVLGCIMLITSIIVWWFIRQAE
jgi:hypothetical protein